MHALARNFSALSTLVAAMYGLAVEAHAGPKVVVSIAPVHSLIAAIMADVGTPELLIPAIASPHAFALRPSDAQSLAGADIVFRVGPELEVSLEKPLAALSRATLVTFAEAPGITEQLVSTDDASDGPRENDHDDEADHADEPEGHAHATDPHIWLSVDNARRIADIAAATLSRHDPDNSVTYARNLAALKMRLDRLEAGLRERLEQVQQRPYVVMHDAYRHFEAEFGLQSAGAITLSPERPPGARRLSEVRELIVTANVRCVFSEPQLPTAIAATVVEGTKAQFSQLDPVGVDIPPGPELYFTLMENLGRTLADCLQD